MANPKYRYFDLAPCTSVSKVRSRGAKVGCFFPLSLSLFGLYWNGISDFSLIRNLSTYHDHRKIHFMPVLPYSFVQKQFWSIEDQSIPPSSPNLHGQFISFAIDTRLGILLGSCKSSCIPNPARGAIRFGGTETVGPGSSRAKGHPAGSPH